MMSHWIARKKSTRDDCGGKENIIPGCTERSWHWGNEVTIFVLGRIGENSAEVLHSIWDFKIHVDTWEKTGQQQQKEILGKHSMKEDVNSENNVEKTRFDSIAEVTGRWHRLGNSAMSERTHGTQPRWCVSTGLVQPFLSCWRYWSFTLYWLKCRCKLLQLQVWMTKLRSSTSKEFGDGLLCLTPFIQLGWKTLSSSSFTSGIHRVKNF